MKMVEEEDHYFFPAQPVSDISSLILLIPEAKVQCWPKEMMSATLQLLHFLQGFPSRGSWRFWSILIKKLKGFSSVIRGSYAF